MQQESGTWVKKKKVNKHSKTNAGFQNKKK